MVKDGYNDACPKCDGLLKRYDTVSRKVIGKDGIPYVIKLLRFKCVKCGSIHREIPDLILPYKQYESEIINGVKDGLITTDMLGYEDYPHEMTMKRWSNN